MFGFTLIVCAVALQFPMREGSTIKYVWFQEEWITTGNESISPPQGEAGGRVSVYQG